jgi:hypothetical protein
MRWIRRWWWLTIPGAVLFLPLLGAGNIKILGIFRLAEVRTELEAAGRLPAYEAWRAELPTSDAVAAEALNAATHEMPISSIGAWLDAVLRGPVTTPPLGPARRRLALSASPAATAGSATAAWLAAQRLLTGTLADQATAAMAVRRALAQQGATLSRRHRLPATSEAARMVLPMEVKAADLGLVRVVEVAQHLRAMALIGPEPAGALDSLRRFAIASETAEFIGDAMISVALHRITDQTHLDAVLMSRAGPETVAQWIDRRPNMIAQLQGSLRAERCIQEISIHGLVWCARSPRHNSWDMGPQRGSACPLHGFEDRIG